MVIVVIVGFLVDALYATVLDGQIARINLEASWLVVQYWKLPGIHLKYQVFHFTPESQILYRVLLWDEYWVKFKLDQSPCFQIDSGDLSGEL